MLALARTDSEAAYDWAVLRNSFYSTRAEKVGALHAQLDRRDDDRSAILREKRGVLTEVRL